MILKRTHIKNFRSLRDVKVSLERQTAILGGNGAGKSTILKALDKFYGASSSVSVEDCFGRNLDDPIEIGLTFTDFNEAERKTFASHIVDEELSVLRVFDVRGGKSSGRYYGFIKGHAPFSSIRNAESANSKRAAYRDLRESGNAIYADLPAIARAEDIEPQLVQWELRHEDECTMVRDDGQFLGFANVAKGSLSKSTSFVLIPAVRDAAADAIDGRGSPISQLMELVVKSAIQRRKDFQDWQERASEEYRQLVNPDNLTELKALADTLTSSLRMLYEETAVSLDWRPASDFSVPLPTADVSLEDGGFPSTVEKQGNGLQRAFILTLLQHLARATMLSTQNVEEQIFDTAESSGLEPISDTIPDLKGVPERQALLPGLILAIEEPELYQHPTKQRHFARVLGLLSDGSLPGVATQMQVVFASHSPYFVCVDRFDEVRLARRHPIPQVTHKECVLRESSLQHVCSLLEVAHGKASGTYSEDGLRARLHILTPELAEGFFADVVVLVEGESDRAAIKAIASVKGVDLEGQGIAVLSANGKENLDRPAAIFQSLDIPVYVIWDCDRKGEKIDHEVNNRALQQLLGSPEDEIVGAGNRITDSFACFDGELETTLKNELGPDALAASLALAMTEFSVVRHADAIKAPAIMSQTLSLLAKQGLASQSLEAILGKILTKKSPIVPQVDTLSAIKT